MSLGQIIRKKREELKLTLDQVSKKIGFSKPYLSTIETGRVNNPPSDTLLKKLERELKFEPGLLLHIAHMERIPPDIRSKYESTEAENQKWRRIVKNLIDSKAKKTKRDKLLAKTTLKADEAHAPLSAGRLVPVINKVVAGYPTDFNDLDYPVGIADDYVRCPDLHDPNAFAVRVIGDSLLTGSRGTKRRRLLRKIRNAPRNHIQEGFLRARRQSQAPAKKRRIHPRNNGSEANKWYLQGRKQIPETLNIFQPHQ